MGFVTYKNVHPWETRDDERNICLRSTLTSREGVSDFELSIEGAVITFKDFGETLYENGRANIRFEINNICISEENKIDKKELISIIEDALKVYASSRTHELNSVNIKFI